MDKTTAKKPMKRRFHYRSCKGRPCTCDRIRGAVEKEMFEAPALPAKKFAHTPRREEIES